MAHEDEDERDMRKIAVYDDEALELMQGWTGGTDDPLYAISSTGGWNYAWVFTDAIWNIDKDLRSVLKIGRDKYQLGKGTFSKKEIDELRTIRDALQMALDDPESELVDEARREAPPLGPGSIPTTPHREGEPQRGPYYSVEAGRDIYRNGEPFIGITREGNTIPADADAVTHAIADALTQMQWEPPWASKKTTRSRSRRR